MRHYIKEGEEVTLMDWGNCIIKKIHKDAAGEVTAIDADLHLEGSVKNTKLKLTWLAKMDELVNIRLIDFDYLITKPKPEVRLVGWLVGWGYHHHHDSILSFTV